MKDRRVLKSRAGPRALSSTFGNFFFNGMRVLRMLLYSMLSYLLGF